jgi:translocator protein
MIESPKAKAGYLAGLIGLCLLVAGTAGLITMPEVKGWYQGLVHPSISPPDSVFGPVWTTLYIMMAVAAWRAWGADEYRWHSNTIRLFIAQLALNFGWSFIFFGLHFMGAAMIEIMVLELVVLATTVVFFKRDPVAGLLMVPYVIWVGFASVLNFGFWALN